MGAAFQREHGPDTKAREHASRGPVARARGADESQVGLGERDAKGNSGRAEYSRAAVESAPVGMLMVDPEGTIVLANRKVTVLLGYGHGELLGRPLEILIPERFHTNHAEHRKQFEADQSERAMAATQDTYVRRRDGSEIAVEIGLNPIQTREGLCVLSTMVDLEEQRQTRMRMATADRMASIGTLAAGVSHGINNPLAYVMANLSFAIEALQEFVKPGTEGSHESEHGEEAAFRSANMDELLGALVQAREGSERIRELVEDLIAFSSKHDFKSGTFDLDPVVNSALNLTSSTILTRAQLVKAFGATRPILGEASQLAHVLLNVLLNAAQSISPGHPEDNEIRVSTWTTASGSAVIEVRDSGPGIPPEIRERMFEPFYTTKPVGEGTGLGLSIAYAIVSDMGGKIEVESVLGEGSTFRIILPTTAPAVSAHE